MKRFIVVAVVVLCGLTGTVAWGGEGEGWLKDVKISGFADFYYEHNFNRPPNVDRVRNRGRREPEFIDPVGVENVLRNFDFKHSEIALSLAEIVIEKPATSIGFRLDLNVGRTTDWVHNLEPGGRDWRFIQQAFVTVPVKSKFGDKIDGGKFVTHHGAEVIESKDNYNYTRGLLFAWAIPYYHAGVRYWHYTNKEQTNFLCLHLYNGWNTVIDNNGSKSWGVMYGFKPSEKTTVVENITLGKEPVALGNNLKATLSGNRFLSDTLITYAANDKTTYVLNIDYGRQSNTSSTLGVSNATWYGIAGYLRRVLNDKQAWVVRLEWFRDKNGFSTGVAQTLREATLTYEIKRNKNLLWRIEARYDKSNNPVFLNRGGTTKKSQTTLAIGTVAMF